MALQRRCGNAIPQRPQSLSHPCCVAEDRLLWYSSRHKDWDVSNGTRPEEVRTSRFACPAVSEFWPSSSCPYCIRRYTWVETNLRHCHVCLHAVYLHKHQADILMYGGEGGGDLRPEFVAKDKWFLAADFQSDQNITVRTRHIRLLPRGLCAAAAVLCSIWASPCMHAHAEALPVILLNLMPHHLQAYYFRAGVQLRCTNKHKEVPVPTSAHRPTAPTA